MLDRHPTAMQECCESAPAPEEGSRSVQSLWNALLSPDPELPFPLEEGGNFIFQKKILEGGHWVGPRTLQPCESRISAPLQTSTAKSAIFTQKTPTDPE